MKVETYMAKKLIEDWLPGLKENNDFRRRFYYMFGLESPSYLDEYILDKYFAAWIEDCHLDCKALARSGEIEL